MTDAVPAREAIAEALFALVSTSSSFNTTGRRLKDWTQVTEQPALFLRYVEEHHSRQEGPGQAQRIEMIFEVWIYVRSTDQDSLPQQFIFPLLDALDTALQPQLGAEPVPGRISLGGLVDHVFRTGKTIVSEGELGSQVVAICPLHVLATLSPF